MNPSIFFLAGLLLAISPFRLTVGSWHLYYSLLGYGLLLISIFSRKITFPEDLMAGFCIAVLISGFLNIDALYVLFQAGFLFSAVLRPYLRTSKPWLENTALGLLFALPALFLMLLLNSIGIMFFAYLMDGLFYFLFIAVIVLSVLYYVVEERKEKNA